jgi:ribosomal protein L37AE/L43A
MTGELQVQVAADELDSARAVASQPIPHDIIEDSETEIPEFVEPKCPKCGSDDVVLEGVDTANRWRCEQCDAEWSDAVEAAGDKSETPADRTS